MSDRRMERRDFVKAMLAGVPAMGLDWSSLPVGAIGDKAENEYDAVIIGSGLGGLSCAAAFARQGFKALVIEQHKRPGGYATTFERFGGFVFDVSLHSTTVNERDGLHNLIPGFPEITDVEFVPHPDLFRIILPDYDVCVPQKDLKGFIDLLASHFPEERDGIQALFGDMLRMAGLPGAGNDAVDPAAAFAKTWGALVDARIKDPKLKAIISSQWMYYGLPPSKLASGYYALPTIDYLQTGGYYPRGRSQAISNALVDFIQDHGGKVLLRRCVEKILVKDNRAYGVRTRDGEEFTGKVVVSNANAHDTFRKMLDETEGLADYLAKQRQYQVSLSSFLVFLGLKEDLVGKCGIKDSEIFVETTYDQDASYAACCEADMQRCGFCLCLYDNIYDGYSPPGKNTLSAIALQGFDHWEPYEDDYFQNKKTAYRAEKERMADILIDRIEARLLPGLSDAIEVKEIGTPLTNVRYTSNYRGAIYGWDQTLGNSGPTRAPHHTPIENLYLAGAWTSPGHGYGGVLWSGLECFGEVMKQW